MKFTSSKSQPNQKLPQAAPKQNATPGASGGGFSPPSGKTTGGQKLSQHPPLPGAHMPTSVTKINGGYGAGGSQIHPSLRKSK